MEMFINSIHHFLGPTSIIISKLQSAKFFSLKGIRVGYRKYFEVGLGSLSQRWHHQNVCVIFDDIRKLNLSTKFEVARG